MKKIVKARVVPALNARLAATIVLLAFSSTAAMAQFFAKPDPDGETVVVDANGQEVPIAQADPVGVRPSYCPVGSYFVSEVQSDKTELILTECALAAQQYTVQMMGAPGEQSE